MRCSGSSFACAAFGCERAGLVNHVCMGAVIGRSIGALGLAFEDACDVSAGSRRELGVSGMEFEHV